MDKEILRAKFIREIMDCANSIEVLSSSHSVEYYQGKISMLMRLSEYFELELEDIFDYYSEYLPIYD